MVRFDSLMREESGEKGSASASGYVELSAAAERKVDSEK